MPTPAPTADELIALIRKSHLPTVIVEGDDDARVVRWLEEKTGATQMSFLEVGGRTNLLRLHARRRELAPARVTFLADRDVWVVCGIPAGFDDLIWTNGYSLENDVFEGSQILNLLDMDELADHADIIAKAAEWYAFEILEYRAGRPAFVGRSLFTVIDSVSRTLKADFLIERQFAPAPIEVAAFLEGNYKRMFRGKHLFDAMLLVLSEAGRDPKYSRDQLVDLTLRMRSDDGLINQLISALRNALKVQMA